MCTIFMKFGTQNKWNMLINDVDPNLKFANLVLKLKCAPIFMKSGVRAKRTC